MCRRRSFLFLCGLRRSLPFPDSFCRTESTRHRPGVSSTCSLCCPSPGVYLSDLYAQTGVFPSRHERRPLPTPGRVTLLSGGVTSVPWQDFSAVERCPTNLESEGRVGPVSRRCTGRKVCLPRPCVTISVDGSTCATWSWGPVTLRPDEEGRRRGQPVVSGSESGRDTRVGAHPLALPDPVSVDSRRSPTSPHESSRQCPVTFGVDSHSV